MWNGDYLLSEGTAARRRLYFHLVDATDGITAEVGEAAGQPQLSKNGAAFGNTSATLTAIGSGRYYVELTAAELDTLGRIQGRYKSAATAEAVASGAVVAYDPYDSVRAGLTALPAAAAGASGGLLINGSNSGTVTLAALTVTGAVLYSSSFTVTGAVAWNGGVTFTNAAGTGLTCSSTGGGGHGTSFLGNGVGHGLLSTGGGTNGVGGRFLGAGSAAGLEAQGAGANGHGFRGIAGATAAAGFRGEGAGAGPGASFVGGSTSGAPGMTCQGGSTAGPGVLFTGIGSFAGCRSVGGVTGDGLECLGGATSGDGAVFQAIADGNGLSLFGFLNGHGLASLGDGTGEGALFFGGETGHGLHCLGGTTSGSGARFEATLSGTGLSVLAAGTNPGAEFLAGTNNDGARFFGAGTGHGQNSVGGATGHGALYQGGGTSGDGIRCTVTSGVPFNDDLYSGIAQAGSSTTITLDAGAPANDDVFNGALVSVHTGTGARQSRLIEDYDGTTKVATITPTWDTNPASGAAFSVSEWGAVGLKPMDSPDQHSGTAQTGTAGTITLAATASATNDIYNGQEIKIYSGTGAGQTRGITDYAGATKVATVDRSWITTPDNTSRYAILASSVPALDATLHGVQISANGIGTTAIAASAITATGIAAAAFTSAKFAADAIDANAVAANVVDEIWAKTMTELTAVPAVSGTTLQALTWIFELARNKIQQTATTQTVFKDDTTTTLATSAVSDNGTVFERAEFA